MHMTRDGAYNGAIPLLPFEDMHMTNHSKYVKDNYYRTSLVVRKEVKPGLDRAVQLSGAGSISRIVTAIADFPDELGPLLAPYVERSAQIKRGPTEYRKKREVLKSTAKELAKQMDNLDADTLAKIQALLTAKQSDT